MTTLVTVKHCNAPVKVQMYNEQTGEPTQTVLVTEGENSFYVYQGQSLRIEEVHE